MSAYLGKARSVLGFWATATAWLRQNNADPSGAASRQYWDLGSCRYHTVRAQDLPARNQRPPPCASG